MKKKQVWFMLVLFYAALPLAKAQVDPEVNQAGRIPQLEDKIEQFSTQSDTEFDYSELVDELLQYVQHPINLNKASERELRQLQLNDLQMYNLQEYIKSYGELTSIYELNLVEGFDSTLISALSPFITFTLEPPGAKINSRNLLNRGRHQILTRYQRVLEPQLGYSPASDSLLRVKPNSRYLGSPDKLYVRYGYNFYNRIRFGITMEKDAGETLWPDNDTLKKGFDFYSAHFYYRGNKFVKHFALGDYHLAFGQGLTMYSSLAFGKSAEAITNRRIVQVVKPNTGANENLFMRGVATTLSPLKQTDITLFYSDKKVDASVKGTDSLSAGEYYISSLQESGYHRTPAELASKNSIRQTVYGAHVQSRVKMFRIGATAMHTAFDTRIQPAGPLYQSLNFQGKALDNYGLDVVAILRKLTFFSEASYSSNGGKALLAGATATPDPHLAISVMYRNYGREYQSFFSNAFAEGSYNANESGLYMGMFAQLHRRLSLSAYADYFRFSWLRFRVDAPSAGVEYLLQLNYNPSRYTLIQLRYRYKQKQLNPSDNMDYTDFPEPESRQNLRLHFNIKTSMDITLKSRVETLWWDMPGFENRRGFLVYQDVIWSPENKPWLLNMRYAVFDTDTYNERMYAYESDVLYAFSIPAYYYKGNRFYLMARLDLGRNVDVWFRYAISQYSNRQTVGSGLDLIEGNHKSEVKVQLRLKF